MFENLHRWLNGVFTCRKCDREFHAFSLGYGDVICPDCYNGETSFIFYDNTFWLNRLLTRLSPTRVFQPDAIVYKPTDTDQIESMHEIEIV